MIIRIIQILTKKAKYLKELNKADFQPIDDSVVWPLLLELHSFDLIYEWIDWSFGSSFDETSTKSAETVSKPLIFNEKLSQSMIDLIPASRTLPTHVKNQILNYLAK